MSKHLRSLFILSLFLGVQSIAFGQVSWQRLFSKKSTDVFRCVIEVPSGGYAAAGYTADSTIHDTDAYVVRLNANGDTLWTFSFNGPGTGSKDLFYKIINTSDGGFAMCGYIIAPLGTDDFLYMKIDGNGVLQWWKTMGGSQRDRAEDIVQTADGGYTICGLYGSPPSQYYDAMIFHTNSSGDSLWSKLHGLSGYETANSIRQLSDGGYIMGGKGTNGANGLDMYLIRTNAAGDSLWTKRFGTTGTDNIESIRVVGTSGFIMCGGTNGAGTNSDDGYLVRTDTGGVVQWTKSFGGTNPDDFHRVEPIPGGYILSGTSSSSGTALPNMWLVKTNLTGDSLWSRTFGGNNHDHGYSAQRASDGGYIFAGYSGSFGFNNEDGLIVKTDSNGVVSNLLTYTSVFGLISPVNNACGASGIPIRVIIRNYGLDTLANIPVTIQISGAGSQTLNQTYPGPVYPGAADTMLFSSTINTTTIGLYTFYCFTGNNNEVYPANNSGTFLVNSIAYSSIPGTTNGSVCGTGTVQLSASSPDNIYWFSASSGGTLLGTGSGYTTPVISSTTTYYAQAGLTCPSTRVAVTATVNPVPNIPNVTPGQRCDTGIIPLGASASDPIRWFDAASGGTQVGSGTSYTTPVLSSTNTYYAETYNGTCASVRIPVTATVNPLATDPIATGNSHCGTGSVSLSATSGDPVNWYDVPSGGTSIGTGTPFSTPSVSTTTTFYVEAFNGTCPSHRISVVATITPLTPDPTVTDDANCGPGILTLGASSGSTLIWYASSSGGTQLGFGATFNTPFISTTTTYYVQATNGVCPGNYIPVNAVINSLPLVDLGPDVFVINTTSLDAGPGFVSYLWSTTETSQTITVSSTNDYCVTITDVNTCTASDCIHVDVSDGVQAINALHEMRVFPNPSNGSMTIESFVSCQQVQISVYSGSGQRIYDAQWQDLFPGTQRTLDLGSVASGIYLLRMTTPEVTRLERILIH